MLGHRHVRRAWHVVQARTQSQIRLCLRPVCLKELDLSCNITQAFVTRVYVAKYTHITDVRDILELKISQEGHNSSSLQKPFSQQRMSLPSSMADCEETMLAPIVDAFTHYKPLINIRTSLRSCVERFTKTSRIYQVPDPGLHPKNSKQTPEFYVLKS
ncbi:hypothetical protein VNO77_27532 [Canavalia gladiata]|uniref:Uncharacterized protein n=1 Tax=Canavalia gladiata TaxID=3824 RepID=A0AAN9KY10_CANGL